jgi:hypothetical protein
MKWIVDEMENWWNGKLMKWKVDEVESWWSGKLMKWEVEIAGWSKCKLMKWVVDGMTLILEWNTKMPRFSESDSLFSSSSLVKSFEIRILFSEFLTSNLKCTFWRDFLFFSNILSLKIQPRIKLVFVWIRKPN